MSNIEPQKRTPQQIQEDQDLMNKTYGVEPEKKDVWEVEFEKFLQTRCSEIDDEESKKLGKKLFGEYEGSWRIDKGKLKSFIKTHFIPRAEVVEKANKIAYLSDDLGGGKAVPLDDLLDLIKNNE